MSQKQKLDVTEISKDNCCELGAWLHGDGRRQMAALASFAGCVSSHAEFHVQAGRVAAQINAGRYDDAQNMLGTDAPYTRASNEVAMAIRRLKKEAG